MPRRLIAHLAMVVAIGCASVRLVDTTGSVELAPNEGLLVVHLIAEIPIKKLTMSQRTVVSNLPTGEHFFLLAVSAGQHQWTEIVIPAGDGDVPFRMGRHDSWRFRVEAGRTNYPGQFTFGGHTRKRSVDISPWRQNRSAFVLRRLRKEFPELLARYPPVYSGPDRDDYLEYYARTFLSADGASAGSRPR